MDERQNDHHHLMILECKVKVALSPPAKLRVESWARPGMVGGVVLT
jgi:hypothetical protein